MVAKIENKNDLSTVFNFFNSFLNLNDVSSACRRLIFCPYRSNRSAQSILQILLQRILFFVENGKQVFAVIVLQHRLRHFLQLLRRYPSLAVSDAFKAGNFQALAFLQHLDESRCLGKGVMRACVKPCEAPRHSLHLQLLVF